MTKYQIVFSALKTVKSSNYNLSTSKGFADMHLAMWKALQEAGIVIKPNQALRAFVGPKDGYWTLMDMAEYISKRCK